MNLSTMLKQPSASLPLALSFGAIVTVLVHVVLFGVGRQVDEGMAAHLWQLLMVGQVPIIVFFAIRWLPQNPKPALQVLALQLCAAITACAPVFLLGF